jgi:hypothetical protein
MISTKNKKPKGDSVTEYRVDHRIRRRGDMWVEVIIRAPLVLEIREAAHDCQAEPGRYCEEIIEQWCAERRLNKVKLGIPLSPRLRHTVEHDALFDREA